MTRGRKPKPTVLRRLAGNPGKRGYNHAEPVPPEGLPDCPSHLSEVARAEWDRIAQALYDMGVVTLVDRAALAAYCQAWGRWVEAEEKLKETPVMLKTPSGLRAAVALALGRQQAAGAHGPLHGRTRHHPRLALSGRALSWAVT